jgi:23S rRNA pseudouridine955/2504/2580 synthase
MQLCRQDDPDALRMELELRVLKSFRDLSLCEIQLFTGRTHQIRVQTAAIGHPVLGDDNYGDRERNKAHHARRQQLLAKKLTVLSKSFISEKELSLEGETI